MGAVRQSLGRRYRLSHGFIHQDRSLTIAQHLEIFQVIVPSIFQDAFEESSVQEIVPYNSSFPFSF